MSWIRQKEWRIKTSVFIELSNAPTGHINSDHLVQITLGSQLLCTFVLVLLLLFPFIQYNSSLFYRNFLVYFFLSFFLVFYENS